MDGKKKENIEEGGYGKLVKKLIVVGLRFMKLREICYENEEEVEN